MKDKRDDILADQNSIDEQEKKLGKRFNDTRDGAQKRYVPSGGNPKKNAKNCQERPQTFVQSVSKIQILVPGAIFLIILHC